MATIILPRKPGLLRYSNRDAIPVAFGIIHLCYLVSLIYFLPFWYFGYSLSYLNGYFEHFGGNPDVPMAWGVTTYHKLYNFVWFNNGYHAEHHFRPRAHWTRMKALKDEIEAKQREVGVRVIKPPHVFGFMDPEVCDEPLVPIRRTDDAPDANDLVDVTESKGAATPPPATITQPCMALTIEETPTTSRTQPRRSPTQPGTSWASRSPLPSAPTTPVPTIW